jgi:hypothetical protein
VHNRQHFLDGEENLHIKIQPKVALDRRSLAKYVDAKKSTYNKFNGKQYCGAKHEAVTSTQAVHNLRTDNGTDDADRVQATS